jgi:hypothetical protein
MKRIYFKTFAILFSMLFVATSCTKDWEQLNTDPNNPVHAPFTNVLAHSIRLTGNAFFDDWQGMNNFCSYSGEITKIQYIDEAKYNYRDNVVYTAWSHYYEIQLDLKKLIQAAQKDNKNISQGVALTWSVYLWQMAVDQWGDIPYTEALQAEEGNNTPKYDKAKDIYVDLLKKIEQANDLLSKPNAADDLGDGDILYNGDAAKWREFANAIHLRIAMRLSYAEPAVAKAEVEKILTNPTKYPLWAGRADEAKLQWQGTNPYDEPYYANRYVSNRDDHGMAKTMIDTLLSFGDPRIAAFAKPAKLDGVYRGMIEGGKQVDLKSISRIGAMYRDDPAGYTYFLRYAEMMFDIAEAANNGWNTGTYTKDGAYAAGIKASFDETYGSTYSPLYGKDEAAALAAYMANPKVKLSGTAGKPFDLNLNNDMTKIFVQKWIAMFKEGQELWAFQRRTNYPPMSAAPESVYPNHTVGPFRYPYPSTEFNLNKAHVEEAAQGIVDHFWGKQIFWDTRKGVQ